MPLEYKIDLPWGLDGFGQPDQGCFPTDRFLKKDKVWSSHKCTVRRRGN